MKPKTELQNLQNLRIPEPPGEPCPAHPLLVTQIRDLQGTLRREITELDQKLDRIQEYITRQQTLEEEHRARTQLLNNIFLTSLSSIIGFLLAILLKTI